MGPGSGGYKEEPAPVAADPVSILSYFFNIQARGHLDRYSPHRLLAFGRCNFAFAPASWAFALLCTHENGPFVARFVVHGMQHLPRHYRSTFSLPKPAYPCNALRAFTIDSKCLYTTVYPFLDNPRPCCPCFRLLLFHGSALAVLISVHESVCGHHRMVQNLKKLECYTLVPCSIPFPSVSKC